MSNESRRFFQTVIFALAAIFALSWGPGSSGCLKSKDLKPMEHVATVNGTDIPVRDFARAYSAQLNQMRQQGFPPEMAKQFGIHKQVVDQLIVAELLSQAAESRGIVASDLEVRDVLFKQPDFQKDGRFDQETYVRIIRDYEGTTEIAFEDKLRRQIAAQHVLKMVEEGAVVSDEEVHAKYLKDGDTAKVSFIRYIPTMFSDKVANPKPAELAKYAAAHEKELQASYDANKTAYFVPEKVKARQILLRVSKEEAATKKGEVKARADNIRKEIVENKKSFAEMATQFSEDLSTKEKGGDLGLVDRLELAPGFADSMFALKPGEVTAVVETPVGFMLGTIEEKTAPTQKPFESVKNEIASQMYIREKARELAKAEADRALAEVKKGKKLAELYAESEGDKKDKKDALPFGSSTKPEVKESGEFNSSADAIPQLGTSPELSKTIFALKAPAMIDHVVSIGDTFAIVDVTDRKPTSEEDFEKQKEQLKTEAIKAKQYEVRDSFLKALKASSQSLTNDAVVNKVIGEG